MSSLSELSDEDIAKKMQQGNLEIFSELVKRYQHKLVRYAVTIVKDHDIAVDVVQDSLIKAYTKINSFNPDKNFSSWIFRIVHNQAIDYIRKHKKEVALNDQEWLLNSLAVEADDGKNIDKKLLKAKLNQCLDALPVNYRTVLTLYYMDEKSYQEISDILRLPIGTVATRLSRGKKALSALCTEHKGYNYV